MKEMKFKWMNRILVILHISHLPLILEALNSRDSNIIGALSLLRLEELIVTDIALSNNLSFVSDSGDSCLLLACSEP